MKRFVETLPSFEKSFDQVGTLVAEGVKRKAKIIGKEAKGAKGQGDKVWAEVGRYFADVRPELVAVFHSLGERGTDLSSVMNMCAVNRLAAIAKMLQYCKDTNTNPQKFKEGRVFQKIRAWHKIHKITSAEHPLNPSLYSACVTPYTDKEGACYPLMEELDYLQALDIDNLEEETTKLKTLLLKNAQDTWHEESEFTTLVSRNRELMHGIEERIRDEPRKVAQNAKIVEEYGALVPSMKHRRESAMKKEKKVLKSLHTEEKSLHSTCNSKTGSLLLTQECGGSHTNEGQKEEISIQEYACEGVK